MLEANHLIGLNCTSTPGPVKSILVKVFPAVKIYVSQSLREAYVAQYYKQVGPT